MKDYSDATPCAAIKICFALKIVFCAFCKRETEQRNGGKSATEKKQSRNELKEY